MKVSCVRFTHILVLLFYMSAVGVSISYCLTLNMKVLAVFLALFGVALGQTCSTTQVDRQDTDQGWLEAYSAFHWCNLDQGSASGSIVLRTSNGNNTGCTYRLNEDRRGDDAAITCGSNTFSVNNANNMAIAKAEVLCRAKRSLWPDAGGNRYRVRSEADGRPHDANEPIRVFNC